MTSTSRLPRVFVRIVTILAALTFLIPGAWAFGWPHSFFQNVAPFPPYNQHLFHDLGAFQIGVGAAVVAGLAWRDGLLAALAAAFTAMLLHTVSHVVDDDLGGHTSDKWLLGALTLLLLVALVVRRRCRGGR